MDCNKCKHQEDCVNVGAFKKGDCLQFEEKAKIKRTRIARAGRTQDREHNYTPRK